MNLRQLILAALFAAVTAVMSIIAIPLGFTPVPFTLQVLAVLLAGAVLGMKTGFISQLTYVILGAVGLPVFAQNKGGIAVLFGPRGGYIIGFVIAAAVIGLLCELIYTKQAKKILKIAGLFIAMLIGIIIIYIFGATGLMLIGKMSLQKAITAGVIPFIPLDIIKAVIAAFLAYILRERLSKAGLI